MGNPAAIFSVVLAGFCGLAACAAPPIARGGAARAPAPAPPAPPAEAPSGAASTADTSKDAKVAALPSPQGTAVLHIGDSFAVAGFAQALRPRLAALGVRYEVRAEQSSFTTTWASKMWKVVADTQPDLVIINLGANEVANTDPSTHASHVRRIVRAIGDRPCVWVSPPLWRKDTGITDVIRENSAPCRFFDSDALVRQPIPRQSDHIHPNEAGGAIWAEAFWAWLSEQREPSADSSASRWRLKPAPPEEHRPHAGDSP
jgi:hypothetical protein